MEILEPNPGSDKDRSRHAQHLESLGTLAAGIAHDFNNILSAILGYTELARLRAKDDESLKKYLENAVSACMRAKELIAQILTFARGSDKARKPLELLPLIKESLKFIGKLLPDHIEVFHELAPDLGVVETNPVEINQILMNLATNAIHAMEAKGGTLKIRANKIHVPQALAQRHGVKSGLYVLVSVEDTGTGIRPEILGKIFEPYFTTKRKGKGTGLGLAIVDSLVRNMGGFIEVASELEKGSRFDVYLPIVETQRPQEVREEAVHGKVSARVMLIEDEQELLDVLSLMLKEMGCQVEAFSDPEKAMEAFLKDPDRFDLIISDISMPKATGLEIFLESRELTPDIPVIFISGYSGILSKEKAREIGADGFLEKPIVMKDLQKLVLEVLRRRG